MKPIISVKNLSKKYQIKEKLPYYSLRDSFINLVRGYAKTSRKSDFIWALKDVSFDVIPGGVLGIIGNNGSGKSTLLKILSQITPPTSGTIVLDGRVASLLEVGTGFHPELTGRENIYLNGAILGMSRKEIKKKFDEIVDFAEIEKFLDTPVKHYSSGMYVRLAFSVAAHLESEILLVDEVLAVGDEFFQKKCIDKIIQIKQSGKTIILVSHNLNQISALCQKVMVLHNGVLLTVTSPEMAINRYFNVILGKGLDQNKYFDYIKRHGLGDAKITNILMITKGLKKRNIFHSGDYIKVRLFYECKRAIMSPNFGLAIYRNDGVYCYGINCAIDKSKPVKISGKGFIDIEYPQITLLDGNYYFDVAIYGETEEVIYDYISRAFPFKIISEYKNQGLVSIAHEWIKPY